ncbi:PucR family transcriptional regulator ligand-binding domain-containing protein [Actinoallomurus spadix]|uniref:PucR family transcriptional regulator n=1 Tax=Actinoallomurus spadix TaxID=79912 RepID=A0ABN0W3S2_9ACTN|nr:PucR family transcriptional regulator ligand-binding domain-containing protein [Actinoallomurus spadix]MCO5985573.1 PucR family transcriptional regulator ligand-binding domain-containing protein [Actinoallomurus spadix]
MSSSCGSRPPALRPAGSGIPAYGLSVEEVLGLPTLAGARLVAGAGGLDRVVERLNVMEVPDVFGWVKPNELLLTTGYPLRHTSGTLGRLVADLNACNLTALAVKPGRYLERLPDEMLEQADRLGLPLIRLPEDAGFDDILNQVLARILDRRAAALARGEEVHRALVQIVLCGGGLQEVTDEVATLLGAAVTVLDGDGRQLAASGDEALLTRLRGALAGLPPAAEEEAPAPGVLDHVPPAGVPASWPAGAAPREPAPGLDGPDTGDGPGTAPDGHLVVPVVAGGFTYGRMAVLGVSAADTGVLERVATVVALVITRQHAVSAVESKYRAYFLRDVLTGRSGADERVIAHSASFGWDLGRPATVVVAEPDQGPARGGTEERVLQDRLVTAWTSAVRRRDRKGAVAGFSGGVVAVVAADACDAPALAKDAAAVFADQDRTFSTGVSRVAQQPGDLPSAYDQAVRAVRVGRQMNGDGAVVHFDELGVFRLLSLVEDTAELHSFVQETLGELAGDQDSEAVDLRRTLQVLLETNLNVAETARRLHFHYNTLRYRIGKLERLLGPFTDDAHLRLNLTLALHVLRMRGI